MIELIDLQFRNINALDIIIINFAGFSYWVLKWLIKLLIIIDAAAAVKPKNINFTWVGNYVWGVAYLLANQPNNDSTNTDGIVNIINDKNPIKGDLVNNIVKLTTNCITVGPGNAQHN